ncbi:hypothetical protein FM113_13575 [Leucobacter sp. 7(1)]|uniref:SRPBCC family protein n=1 Tax=Leucobacter sp. 7(1) TaxID=1255613 RepID=UPI00097EDB84|nr:SRPBCC domain-containing protein [Leucobacter sp. 7(1)]SJN11981.1 hypothetical protein FM113_13575 [Leucobacter sp. 7(1)]
MTSTEFHSIEVDEFLPHPANRIWEALTNPSELGKWFMSNDFLPEVGHAFTLDTGMWGRTHCTVLEIETHRLLRYSWLNGPLNTIVTWKLVPEGIGTRILVEHEGFDLSDPAQRQAFEGMAGGWRSTVIRSLSQHLGPS